ncbi:MAG: iron-sulfur cluster assembly scaffold protein [Alphaproteobacteria bacterium]|nr:iron-sulfur cluster assembly scaffold protein [Alphaproteobacteria bacterium]
MEYSAKIENMCCITQGKSHGAAPIPQEGEWAQVKDISQINGLSHGVDTCAPQQGACKLTLNVKNGIIQEALVETIGCSGMTHSAAMACEILQGKTILEALNTDLVCDAINVAMRSVFEQLVYGRTQTAFSKNGLPVGASLDDLGKGLCSQVGSVFGSQLKGVRYLELTEGYITKLALDSNKEVIGYESVNVGTMLNEIKQGIEPQKAYENNIKQHGRFKEAAQYIDPRKE